MKTHSLPFVCLLFLMATANGQPKQRATPVDSENAPDPRIKLQADPPPDPNDDPDNPVPITGLEYLIVGGGLLGTYRTLKSRFTKRENKEGNL